MTRHERLRRQGRLLVEYRARGDHEMERALLDDLGRQAKTQADVALITVLRVEYALAELADVFALYTRQPDRVRAVRDDG